MSLPLGNLFRLQEFIFSAASLENDILTPFTWKSLCLFISNSGLCADRASQRARLLMDINSKENEERKEEEKKERKKEQTKMKKRVDT